MAEAVARTNLLDQLAPQLAAVADASAGAVCLGTATWRAQVDLQLAPGQPAAERAVAAVLGVALPAAPGAVATAEDLTILWLGPEEWLIVAAEREAEEIEGGLRRAVGDQWASVVDVSANRVGLTLSGPAACDVLKTCCTLDLRQSGLPVGTCAQTLVGRAPVILHRTDPRGFTFWVRPSLSRYLAQLLLDAGREYEAPRDTA
jgi:sarcosine oxidase subunit gamma